MMKEKLNNKIAFITGAGSGIGRAIALRLARDKINLVLCGRDAAKLGNVCEEVKTYGVESLILQGDLTDDNHLFSCIDKAAEHFGGIDILINNAGMALNCEFEKTEAAQFDQVMKLNVRVPYFLCQKAIPWLRKSTWATIINISSVVGHKGYPFQSAYAASKHAVIGFTKSLANEVFEEDIRVHVISPGGVFTDMVAIARPDLSHEGMIMPEDIAEIAAFMIEQRKNAVIDEICVHRAGKAPFI